MWGEDGIVLSVLVATVAMGVAVLAAFVALEGIGMWVAVATLVAAWLATITILGKRYGGGRWPFGKANPWDGQ